MKFEVPRKPTQPTPEQERAAALKINEEIGPKSSPETPSTGIKRLETETREGPREDILEASLRLRKEQNEISEKIAALNEEGLKLGREKYGFDAVEWTLENKNKLEELFRKSRENMRLLNEIGKFILTDAGGNLTLRPEANVKNFEDVKAEFEREIGESYARIQQKIKEEQISPGDTVVAITGSGYELHKGIIGGVDPKLGLVYFLEELPGGGTAEYAVDIRNVKNLKKIFSGNKFQKITEMLGELFK